MTEAVKPSTDMSTVPEIVPNARATWDAPAIPDAHSATKASNIGLRQTERAHRSKRVRVTDKTAENRKKPEGSRKGENSIVAFEKVDNKIAASALRDFLDEPVEEGDSSYAAPRPSTHTAGGPPPMPLDQTLKDRVMQEALRHENEARHSKHYRLMLDGGWIDKTDVWEKSDQHRTGSFGSASGRCDLPAYHRGQYISLDPDRSPMAADHPARVWNAMLHALKPDLQPVVKWRYERAQTAEGPGWQATLTLILPPSHPAITGHPLAYLVPSTPYSREYVKVTEVLGGARSWTGEARKFKADASNTALVKAIADGAMDWITDPIMQKVGSDDDDDLEVSRQVLVGQSELVEADDTLAG